MDYSALIAQRRRRLGEIDDMISDPGFYDDPKRASEIMREHRRIQQTLALSDRLDASRRQLEENEELAKGDDPELSEIAREEIGALTVGVVTNPAARRGPPVRPAPRRSQ